MSGDLTEHSVRHYRALNAQGGIVLSYSDRDGRPGYWPEDHIDGIVASGQYGAVRKEVWRQTWLQSEATWEKVDG